MSDDIVDLAAFRAAKIEAQKKALDAQIGANSVSIKFRYDDVDNRVVMDMQSEHCDINHELNWSPEDALEFARQMMIFAGGARRYARSKDPAIIKAREEERERRRKAATVPIVGKNGKKLPPLKIAGWAIETFGGHTGVDAPTHWVRMSRNFKSEYRARQLIQDYIRHGYRPDRVRVVPVDHRGRVIPAERMPAS